MFVYIQSEPGLWTVGHYDPKGHWIAESDWDSAEKAAAHCHYLNGGNDDPDESIAETVRRNADARRYQP